MEDEEINVYYNGYKQLPVFECCQSRMNVGIHTVHQICKHLMYPDLLSSLKVAHAHLTTIANYVAFIMDTRELNHEDDDVKSDDMRVKIYNRVDHTKFLYDKNPTEFIHDREGFVFKRTYCKHRHSNDLRRDFSSIKGNFHSF